MNGTSNQLEPLDSFRPAEGTSAPQAFPAGTAEQAPFRFNCRRSLRIHRKLVLGFGLLGLVLAVAYLVLGWPSLTALSLNDFEPASSPLLEGAAAILLPLAFAGLGLLVAVAAHKLNPKIYIAADAQQLLGFAPTATLPDFSDVSEAAASECLLRLASAIDSVCREGGIKSCIFVGTRSGAGVTTIAGRVRDALAAQGRITREADERVSPTALGLEAGDADDLAEENARATALLQRVVEEVEGRRNGLVVGEAAPLTVSAGPESLVRSAACTIVVIESGVTTRAQLRETVRNLQQLNPAAVRFVLNRARLKNADPAFRRAIKEMEGRLRSRSGSEERTVRDARVAAEAVRAAGEGEQTAAQEAAESSIADANARTADAAQTPQKPEVSERAKEPELLPKFDPYLREIQREMPLMADYAAHQTSEIPWWMAETRARSDTALTQPKAANEGIADAFTTNGDSRRFAHETEIQAQETSAHFALPKLSELRGRIFSRGIRELDLAKHGTQRSAEAENLLKHIAPFESLFDGTGAAGNFAPRAAGQAEPEAPLHPMVQVPESEGVAGATNGDGAQDSGRPKITSEPEILPWNLVRPRKSKTRGNGGESVDDVQILPSKRGQYRRKD